MTEFTKEWIVAQRKYIEENGCLNDQLCLEMLDEIEQLQQRITEVEDNREHIEILLCKAEKHRGKNKLSGPHWSTIIRFTSLFDEAARLQHRVDTLEDYIADYCSPIISDKYSEIEHLQARVQELEIQLKSKDIIINNQQGRLNYYATKDLFGGKR